MTYRSLTDAIAEISAFVHKAEGVAPVESAKQLSLLTCKLAEDIHPQSRAALYDGAADIATEHGLMPHVAMLTVSRHREP